METNERLILFGTDVVSWAYEKGENDWGPLQDWDIIPVHEQKSTSTIRARTLFHQIPD